MKIEVTNPVKALTALGVVGLWVFVVGIEIGLAIAHRTVTPAPPPIECSVKEGDPIGVEFVKAPTPSWQFIGSNDECPPNAWCLREKP